MTASRYAPPAIDWTHPDWCVGGHQCTATWRSNGEHVSHLELWDTSVGRIIAQRIRSGDGRRDHIEITVNAPLDPTNNKRAESRARALIAAVYLGLEQLADLEVQATPA